MTQRIKRAVNFLFWLLIILLSPLIVVIVVGTYGCILVGHTLIFIACKIVSDHLHTPIPRWLQYENTNTK